MYQGRFEENKREGDGTMNYSSGARYDGKWKNDMKHGEGVDY